MPDVGDWRTPKITVAPFDGTTSASVIVVAPNGTAAAPIAATGVDGVYTANSAYEFTAEGVWVERWTVTGTGRGSEPEYQIAVGTAQPAQFGTPLASIGHLVARLGRSLTADEKAKAPAMLADASDLIRGFCRRDFSSTTNRVLMLRPVGNRIRLPNKPIVSVDQVEQIGTSGTANRVMTASEWAFDGIDEITIYTCPPDLVPYSGTYADTYKVTVDDGGTIPRAIIGRCCKMVLRTMLAPTAAEGLVQERIGQYSYQFGQFPGGGSPGPVVEMTEADEKALVKLGYRTRAGTIQLRM